MQVKSKLVNITSITTELSICKTLLRSSSSLRIFEQVGHAATWSTANHEPEFSRPRDESIDRSDTRPNLCLSGGRKNSLATIINFEKKESNCWNSCKLQDDTTPELTFSISLKPAVSFAELNSPSQGTPLKLFSTPHFNLSSPAFKRNKKKMTNVLLVVLFYFYFKSVS